jgi:hypothetical protein
MLIAVGYGEKIIILKVKELRFDLVYLCIIGSLKDRLELAQIRIMPHYTDANVRYMRKTPMD